MPILKPNQMIRLFIMNEWKSGMSTKEKNNFMNQHQSERKTLQTIKSTLNYDWMSNNQQHCKIANIKAHVCTSVQHLKFNLASFSLKFDKFQLFLTTPLNRHEIQINLFSKCFWSYCDRFIHAYVPFLKYCNFKPKFCNSILLID